MKNNNDYLMLRKTLYHEMGHINDMTFMPKLYDCILEGFNNKKINAESISSLFWVEYVAEKRTASFENVYNMEICDGLIARKWHCSMADPYSHYDEKNFFYLTKILPYFIARMETIEQRDKYLNQIANQLVFDYISEANAELKHLESKGVFDDPALLKDLYGIINKYFNKFMNMYG